MGQKIQILAQKKLSRPAVFNNRMVVELCEVVHLHYRNIRTILSLSDWEMFCKGMVDAYTRWQKRGEPVPGQKHIELCRKQVATFPHNDNITISLNKNLYKPNEGRIYSEGAGIDEPEYIHVKIRDIRLEMSILEFNDIAEVFERAKVVLDGQPLEEKVVS